MDIVALFQCLQPYVTPTTCHQFQRMALALLVMTGWVTMLGIVCWPGPGDSYRPVQRFFSTMLPWAMLFWVFFRLIPIGSAMENSIALPILTAYSGALYAAYKILLCVLDQLQHGILHHCHPESDRRPLALIEQVYQRLLTTTCDGTLVPCTWLTQEDRR